MEQSQNRNSMLANGTTLQYGKYRIERCLASGGFGNTYEITNTTFGRRFALKEFFIKGVAERLEDTVTVSVPIHDNIPLFDSQKEKFKREAIFLSELNNEHIVHVQDLFEENGTAYYVMDYIEGESLSAYMKRMQQPMAEANVMKILLQLLDALRQAHKKNILHLDIKPGNIILTNDGRVVLIDFGASKQLSPVVGYTLTTTSLAYTPGYAPTEQISQNKQRIGTWTDIYALGATMYNLLSNERPPSCDDLIDDEMFQLPQTVSPKVQQLVKSMMQPSTRKRPQGVDDVRKWLNKQLGNQQNGNQYGLAINDTLLPKEGYNEFLERQQGIKGKSFPTIQIQQTDATVDTVVVSKPQIDDERIKQLQIEKLEQEKRLNELQLKREEEERLAELERQRELALGPIIYNLIKNMVHVDGGTFQMGATPEQSDDAYSDEFPVHNVTIDSFSIGKYEVTQEEWQAVMGNNPSKFKGLKRPVEQVSWNDCQEFIRKLNEKTGMNFRLPTEAEWEHAARGGNNSKHYKYAGSNNLDDFAWYNLNSGNHTHDVMNKKPNELGLYDMSGNVWEWCQDYYDKYSDKFLTNPTGPPSGSTRVGRGGSWNSRAGSCRMSYRINYSPNSRNNNIGFRLAM